MTISTKDVSTPVTVRASVTHSMMPVTIVLIPRVTIRLSIPSRTIRPPLIRPIRNAAASATRIETSSGQPRSTFRWATITALKPATDATDRSKSPVVSGMISARVITTRIAFDDKIDETLDHWAKVSGLMKLKTMTIAANAIGSA